MWWPLVVSVYSGKWLVNSLLFKSENDNSSSEYLVSAIEIIEMGGEHRDWWSNLADSCLLLVSNVAAMLPVVCKMLSSFIDLSKTTGDNLVVNPPKCDVCVSLLVIAGCLCLFLRGTIHSPVLSRLLPVKMTLPFYVFFTFTLVNITLHPVLGSVTTDINK